MVRSMPVAFLALMMAGHVASQQAPPPPVAIPEERDYFPGTAPLGEKGLAKDKFQAMHADPKESARAKYEAAREEFEGRYREFLAGRGTLNFLIESTQRRLEAELGVAENDAQRLAAFERQWEVAWNIDRIDKARYDAGRIPIQDMARSSYFRLDAEIQWTEERQRQQKK